MLINLRNALMAGKRLPYDSEVEYLESTGTQRIDTEIIAKPKTVSDITFRWVGTTSGDAVILGARNNSLSASRFILLMTNQIKKRQIGAGANWLTNGSYAMDTDYNAVTSFDNGSQSQKLDGSTIITGNNTLDNLGINLYLFANNQTGSFNSYATARLYSCKIYQDDLLVRDYIPVRKGAVGYLYDRVSGKLFGNAGTGDFVLGQDVIDIAWVDGEYYAQTGSIGYNTGLARIDDYIAVTGGHSVTWKWGDSVLGTCYLIVYNAQKQQIDYWSPNSATGERTINLNATGAFVRYSIGKNFKDTTFFKDNTTGLYAVRNGKILLP